MQRTWTKVGERHFEADTDEGRLTRQRVEGAIDRLEWVPPTGNFPMMPGMGIKESIKVLRIPKVSAVAISSELAPFGLYGIEGTYKNGRGRVYILDLGHGLTPLASDFWPIEVAAEERIK